MATMATAGKYSAATVEYAGRVSVSYVKRSGCAVMYGIKVITSPVVNIVSRPFVYVKNKKAKALQEKQLREKALYEEQQLQEKAFQEKQLEEKAIQESILSAKSLHEAKIKLLEEKIALIEKQLATLEKNGMRVYSSVTLQENSAVNSHENMGEQQALVKQHKMLTSQKSAFLLAIVNENKALRN
ncbi:MAG: hypothetical protein HQK67_00475 [Desulfamplus sp.]|nr:hypothetical protein [Desulfamplus sp.]